MNKEELEQVMQKKIDVLNTIHNDYRRTALERISYQENQIKTLQEENEKLKQMLPETYGCGWTIEFERMFAK